MDRKRFAQGSIVLFLVVVVFWVVARELFEIYGVAGGESLNIAVSGALSLALVLLYYRQMEVLQSQRDLLTQEINMEARQQHTETLRDVVREWLGEYSPSHFGTSDEMSGANTPTVQRSTFESAPDGLGVIDNEDTFHVAPVQLRDNRYFEDLLRNHASDLEWLKARIEQLHQKYSDYQATFEAYCSGPTRERQMYTLKPTEQLPPWIFHQLVRLERGYRDDWEDMVDVTVNKIADASGSFPAEKKEYRVEAGHTRNKMCIYRAQLHDQDTDQVDTDEIQDEAIGGVQEVLTELEANDDARKIIQDAAATLDASADAVAELEETLVEYEGRPIIPGDCPYLKEASIDSETL